MGTTADKLAYLAGTKSAIREAIIAKGVDVPESTTFRAYADKIGEISGGGTGHEYREITVSTSAPVAAFFSQRLKTTTCRTLRFLCLMVIPREPIRCPSGLHC